ncbi:MAG TPA: vWA domain-containing protein [Deltaproteobacteria bacterium]|nr:vWA domain-containing protein [Deltaproteobacteria bacterium]HPP80547.1 vWA domain-containing protein [Deltaproteobacteria bacterium]
MSTTSIDGTKEPQGHGPLSASWRRNLSSVEALEMANVLRALRKVVGHLGTNAPEVEYAGFPSTGANSIFVDPARVMGTYPVPHETSDVLIGEVVHEAILGIEWTDRVRSLLVKHMSGLGMIELVKFQRMVSTGEHIYADAVLDGTVLGAYASKARRHALRNSWAVRSREKSGFSYDTLMLSWIQASFLDGGSHTVHKGLARCMDVLLDLTASLARIAGSSRGQVFRCEERSSLYLKAWSALEPLVRDVPVIDRRLVWSPGDDPSPARKAPGHRLGTQAHPACTEDLVRRVELELARSSSDLTPLVRAALGGDDGDVVPISRWDYRVSAHPVVDRAMAARIAAVFRIYAERRPRLSRGLAAGRVDGRRLYRVPLSGRCFFEREAHKEMDWNITLLCDASGSMRGAKWKTVESTIATICKALEAYRGMLNAYAYFENDGVCMLSSLLEGGRLFAVPPGGRTASGQAIIAAGLLMPSSNRRRLLIHVTDGESNYGCSVQKGIDFCRAQGIHLVTIGCGCHNRRLIEEQYGDTIEFLDSYRQLPKALEHLFRRVFVYGAKPGKPARAALDAARETLPDKG